MENIEFSVRLKERREELKISFAQLAKLSGLNMSTLKRYESGHIKNVKLGVIEQLANIMQVNPAWLCGVDDNKFRNVQEYLAQETDDIAIMIDSLIEMLENDSDCYVYNGNRITDQLKMSLIGNLLTTQKIADKLSPRHESLDNTIRDANCLKQETDISTYVRSNDEKIR